MLLLGIVQQQAKLHAFAGQFAIGQRAHAGQDRRDAGIGSPSSRPLRAAPSARQLADHLFEVGDEQVGGGGQILGAAVAIAAGAVGRVEIGVGAVAGAGLGAVQVLAPEQEFDGVIAGGDIGFDVAGFLQRARQEFRRDLRGIDLWPLISIDGLAITLAV